MDITKLKEAINKRKALSVNDDYGIERQWKVLTDILSLNVPETIEFFRTECTDEEFFWLSEVFEDVAEKTQSRDFISAIKDRVRAVANAEYVQSIMVDIEFAELRMD